MEFSFEHMSDGTLLAECNDEHQAFAHWLNQEIRQQPARLKPIMQAIAAIKTGQQKQYVYEGHYYQINLDREDVIIKPREWDELPDDEDMQNLHLDEDNQAACGLEDFEELLISWSKG
jgi:uncharacterized protein